LFGHFHYDDTQWRLGFPCKILDDASVQVQGFRTCYILGTSALCAGHIHQLVPPPSQLRVTCTTTCVPPPWTAAPTLPPFFPLALEACYGNHGDYYVHTSNVHYWYLGPDIGSTNTSTYSTWYY